MWKSQKCFVHVKYICFKNNVSCLAVVMQLTCNSWTCLACCAHVDRAPGSSVFWLAELNLLSHGLRTPREEIAFTAMPKIQSQSQTFRYGRSIFCLSHRTNFPDSFHLCLYRVSVVRDANDLNWKEKCSRPKYLSRVMIIAINASAQIKVTYTVLILKKMSQLICKEELHSWQFWQIKDTNHNWIQKCFFNRESEKISLNCLVLRHRRMWGRIASLSRFVTTHIATIVTAEKKWLGIPNVKIENHQMLTQLVLGGLYILTEYNRWWSTS